MNINSVQASTKKFSKREALSFAWKALSGNFGFLALTVFITCVVGNIPSILYSLKPLKSIAFHSTGTSVLELYLSSPLGFSGLSFVVFTPVVYSIIFKLYDGQSLNWKDFIPDPKKVWKVFLLTLLFLISCFVLSFIVVLLFSILSAIFTPFIVGVDSPPKSIILVSEITSLLMIFGIGIFLLYLLLRLIFVGCFIVDCSNGPLEAIKESWKLTRNNIVNLFVLLLISTPMLWKLPLGMMRVESLIGANLFLGLKLVALMLSGLVYVFVLLSIVYAYRKLSSSPEGLNANE